MTRLEFLQEIFKFFGKKDEDLLRAYDMALTTKDNIDWERLYKKVITEVESRYLPAPKWFIEKLPSYIIEDEQTYQNESGTGVLKLHSGTHIMDMWHNTLSITEINNNYKNHYGKNFISFTYYPPSYVFIGHKVFKEKIKPNGQVGLELCEVL